VQKNCKDCDLNEGRDGVLTNSIELLQLNIREGTRGGGHGT
jgi:hypothetical protein